MNSYPQQPPVVAPPPQGYPYEGYPPKDAYPPPGYPQSYQPQIPSQYPPQPQFVYGQPPPPPPQQNSQIGCLEGCFAGIFCCCCLEFLCA